MMDVLRLSENLQKESQKALTTITDILMAKDILIRQLLSLIHISEPTRPY